MLQGNRRLFSAFSIEKRERIYESVLSGGRIIIVVPGDGRRWKCFFYFHVFSPPQSKLSKCIFKQRETELQSIMNFTQS